MILKKICHEIFLFNFFIQSQPNQNPVFILGYNFVLGVMPFWIKKTLQKERPKRGLIV
jgi:hypothetical protein